MPSRTRTAAYCFVTVALCNVGAREISCDRLQLGQFRCAAHMQNRGDGRLQIPCPKNSPTVEVRCEAVHGITCVGMDGNQSFTLQRPCVPSDGKSFHTALLLSIFFGWMGLDRFYLGYVGIGLFKLCTFGFFFLFHLADIILIAMQMVGPADGTEYAMQVYGPALTAARLDNSTCFIP